MSEDEFSMPGGLGVLLRLAHQRFASAVEEALASEGFDDLKPHYANVFTFVPPEGLAVTELAAKAGVRKQTMAQVVEELEALGYAERKPHPTDRRSRLVFLTERGRGVRPVAMKAGQQVQAQWARLLGETEMAGLISILQALLRRLEQA